MAKYLAKGKEASPATAAGAPLYRWWGCNDRLRDKLRLSTNVVTTCLPLTVSGLADCEALLAELLQECAGSTPYKYEIPMYHGFGVVCFLDSGAPGDGLREEIGEI